jgi:tetratricopeptide (TPR) repeat protein
MPLLKRGLDLCRDADLPLALPPVASSLGTAYAQAGRLGKALSLLEQAVEQAASIRLDDRQTLRMGLLGAGYLHAARLQEALSLAQEALALARERRERGVERSTLHLLGAVAAYGSSPDVAQAERNCQQAIPLASDLGMRPLLAHSALGLGTLYCHTGQRAQAHDMLSTAPALFKAMGMTSWLAQAENTFKQLAGQQIIGHHSPNLMPVGPIGRPCLQRRTGQGMKLS